MKSIASRLWSAVAANGKSLLFVASLIGLAFGCWLAWEPLGFIVPCSLVLTLMILAQLRPVKTEDRSDDA